MTLAILRLARWLAWQLGDSDRPVEGPPARITVISGSAAPEDALVGR